LLGEFKLTAMEYKARFDKASKRFDETHVLFVSRLHNELRYYLSSRSVDNFEKLCNLLVSDKLKSCLAPGTLNYVLSLEGEGCFQPDQVARLADTYINCHIGAASSRGQFSPPRRGGYKPPPSKSFQGFKGGKVERPPGNATAASQSKEVRPTPTADQNRFVRRCWHSQSTNHLAKDCPPGRESRPPTRYSNHVQIAPAVEQVEGQLQTDNVCSRVLCEADSVMLEKQCGNNACWEFGNFPEVNYCEDVTECSAKPPPELNVSKLQ